MNNQRRKEIKNLIEHIGYIKSELERIISDEENYYDNIPENLQGSDRAMTSEESIDSMNEALNELENSIDELEVIL